ncbi:MAG: hypothetical protein IIV12_03285, partial [Bacteroidales bacterium]|nr:hypothetical protein [Bacteroidales bacterium]
APIKAMTASTYQAVSGAGANGPIELMNEVEALREGKTYEPKVCVMHTSYVVHELHLKVNHIELAYIEVTSYNLLRLLNAVLCPVLDYSVIAAPLVSEVLDIHVIRYSFFRHEEHTLCGCRGDEVMHDVVPVYRLLLVDKVEHHTVCLSLVERIELRHIAVRVVLVWRVLSPEDMSPRRKMIVNPRGDVFLFILYEQSV